MWSSLNTREVICTICAAAESLQRVRDLFLIIKIIYPSFARQLYIINDKFYKCIKYCRTYFMSYLKFKEYKILWFPESLLNAQKFLKRK